MLSIWLPEAKPHAHPPRRLEQLSQVCQRQVRFVTIRRTPHFRAPVCHVNLPVFCTSGAYQGSTCWAQHEGPHFSAELSQKMLGKLDFCCGPLCCSTGEFKRDMTAGLQLAFLQTRAMPKLLTKSGVCIAWSLCQILPQATAMYSNCAVSPGPGP